MRRAVLLAVALLALTTPIARADQVSRSTGAFWESNAEMASMVACGVNLVGFDMLHPGDERLETLVWSWATDEPSAPGCALQGADGRWVPRPCREKHRVACFADGAWSVSAKPVRFDRAARACSFAAPWNGWENQRLLAAGGGDVWVASESEGGA